LRGGKFSHVGDYGFFDRKHANLSFNWPAHRFLLPSPVSAIFPHLAVPEDLPYHTVDAGGIARRVNRRAPGSLLEALQRHVAMIINLPPK
jgi:hypothetical protein